MVAVISSLVIRGMRGCRCLLLTPSFARVSALSWSLFPWPGFMCIELISPKIDLKIFIKTLQSASSSNLNIYHPLRCSWIFYYPKILHFLYYFQMLKESWERLCICICKNDFQWCCCISKNDSIFNIGSNWNCGFVILISTFFCSFCPLLLLNSYWRILPLSPLY